MPAGDWRHTPVVSLNYDAGETVGWQAFVREIGTVYESLPAAARSSTTVLASNYGEAGAVGHLDPPKHLGVNNDEQGAPVWVCSRLRASWTTIWPRLRDFG